MAKREQQAGQDSPDQKASYFLSISLENVRCFGPKQTLDLSDGNGRPARWTVILGVNGTGKTTLLQSLAGFHLLHRPRTQGVKTNDVQHTIPSTISYNAINPYLRRNQSDSTIKIDITPLSPISQRKRVIEFRATSDSYYTENSYTPEHMPWCCAYGAGRRMGNAELKEAESDDSIATLFSDRAELRNPEAWLLRLDYAASKAKKGQPQTDYLDKVKSLLLSVLPENEVTDIRMVTTQGPNPSPRVEFETPYGWIPLRQLGYGYQTLITWVTDLANRMVEQYPNSPNPLEEPVVVIVDEIDLHLHPIWQRQLMDFLTKRFPKAQFIVTAHSPLVAQAAADANLAVLRRVGDHVVIDNDVDNISRWRVGQILTSDLFGLPTARPPHIEKLLKEREQLLTKRKLSEADKKRLGELESEIGELPMGDTSDEVRERQQIRDTIDMLKRHFQGQQ